MSEDTSTVVIRDEVINKYIYDLVRKEYVGSKMITAHFYSNKIYSAKVEELNDYLVRVTGKYNVTLGLHLDFYLDQGIYFINASKVEIDFIDEERRITRDYLEKIGWSKKVVLSSNVFEWIALFFWGFFFITPDKIPFAKKIEIEHFTDSHQIIIDLDIVINKNQILAIENAKRE